MLVAAATILVGFIVLVWSADLFVAGSASIAENWGISPIIIGLTIVSLGTSAPEVLVSITAALSDAGELAIGNAIGSNIANVGLVLGITVLVAPLCVHQNCMRQEMPTLLVVTIGCGLLMLDGELSRLDGLLMLGALGLILVQMVRSQSEDSSLVEEAGEEELPHLRPLRAWVTFLVGLALLIASSRLLVWGAAQVAVELGVSQLVIGLTIVAVGTSLPELAATVASALRGHTEIAIGNVIGSNLFNLLAVMAHTRAVRHGSAGSRGPHPRLQRHGRPDLFPGPGHLCGPAAQGGAGGPLLPGPHGGHVVSHILRPVLLLAVPDHLTHPGAALDTMADTSFIESGPLNAPCAWKRRRWRRWKRASATPVSEQRLRAAAGDAGARHRHRHGQVGPYRPQDRRHPGQHRHPGFLCAPGRGQSRRHGHDNRGGHSHRPVQQRGGQ